jgi:hypothetical protein
MKDVLSKKYFCEILYFSKYMTVRATGYIMKTVHDINLLTANDQ